MYRGVQTRRGTLRTESMPARAKPDRRSQFNIVRLEGAKLLGILGQEIVGRCTTSLGHPEPVEFGINFGFFFFFFYFFLYEKIEADRNRSIVR